MYDLSTGVILVDFWSPMCGPCRRLNPIIKEIQEDFNDVRIVKINTMDDTETAKKYGITALPTLVFLNDGEVVNTMVGIQSKETIINQLDKMK